MLKVFKHPFAVAVFLAFTIGAGSVYAQPQRISSELASELAVDEDGRVYWLRVGFSEGGEVPQLRRYLGSDNITTLEPNATDFRGLRAQAPFLFYFRQSITRGARVLLRGFTYDADDGSLPGAAMGGRLMATATSALATGVCCRSYRGAQTLCA